jgi:hypothetical protein
MIWVGGAKPTVLEVGKTIFTNPAFPIDNRYRGALNQEGSFIGMVVRRSSRFQEAGMRHSVWEVGNDLQTKNEFWYFILTIETRGISKTAYAELLMEFKRSSLCATYPACRHEAQSLTYPGSRPAPDSMQRNRVSPIRRCHASCRRHREVSR